MHLLISLQIIVECGEGQYVLHMNNHIYCVIPHEVPARWDNAEATCQLIGGHLATIETAEAFREITFDLLPLSDVGNEDELWIGLNDRFVEGNVKNAVCAFQIT